MSGFFRVIRNAFLVVCVFIALFAVVGYAAGWVKFRNDDQRGTTTIEVDRNELKNDVESAVEKGKNMINGVGDDEPNDKDDMSTDKPKDEVTSEEEFPGDTAPPKEYDEGGAASPQN